MIFRNLEQFQSFFPSVKSDRNDAELPQFQFDVKLNHKSQLVNLK